MPSPQLSRYAYIYVNSHPNSDVRLRDMDDDSQHHQHVGYLLSSVSQNHHEDLMVWPHHQWWEGQGWHCCLTWLLTGEEDWLDVYPDGKRTSSKCGKGLGARGWQEEEREAKEEVEMCVHLKNISKIQYWFDPHQCCFSDIYLTGSHWSSTVARLLHCYGKVMHFLSIPWGFDVEDDLVGVWYKNM